MLRFAALGLAWQLESTREGYMTLRRRVVLVGAAVMALAAGSGGAIAFAQDDSGTTGSGEAQGTQSEPPGDDSAVPVQPVSSEPPGDDSTVSSEPAGDDTTGSAEAPAAVVTRANFTG
jgi:hypothetical protein